MGNHNQWKKLPAVSSGDLQRLAICDLLRSRSTVVYSSAHTARGAWDIIRFEDYRYLGNDNHNVAVLGICQNDGTIHLAFDHHNNPLHYQISLPGVANDPDDVTWGPSLFSDMRDYLREGEPLARVTYPAFLQTPHGNLLFFSRDGVPTNGRVTLAEYDPENGGWTSRWNVTSSEGTYAFEDRVSNGRYAYVNGVHYGPSGLLHMSWCWREDMGSVFADVNYACSDDNGLTWRNSSGAVIGGENQLIGVDSPGIKVWDVNPHQGQDNMMGQYIDGLDRPHIIISRLRDGDEPLPVGQRDLTRSSHYHYWRDTKGTWHQNEVWYPVRQKKEPLAGPDANVKGGVKGDSTRNHRAKLLSTSENDLIAMFNFEGQLVIVSATAETGYQDWLEVHREAGPWNSEPLPDLTRWQEEGILSIYTQRAPSRDGEPTDLYVISFSIAATKN